MDREEMRLQQEIQKKIKLEEQIRLANEQREKDLEMKKLAESSKYQKLTTFFAGPTDRVRIEPA